MTSERRLLPERLVGDARQFDFFQAVRLLGRLQPDRRPVGRDEHPRDEIIRFRAHCSSTFPAAEIEELRDANEAAGSDVPTMIVNFMGLFGPQGTLPHHYSLRIRRALAASTDSGEGAPLRAFLDIFNHRLISLFYRAWEKYRFPIAFERGEHDRFSQQMFCLIGLGTAGLQGRFQVPDHSLLYYAGLLAKRPRSATALEGVLQDYFGVPVEIVAFQGQWFQLDPGSLTRLSPGGHNALGVDAMLWSRVWDPQVRFRIKLGPMPIEKFRAFLPTGDAYRPLVELTRFVVGEEFNFDVQLVLQKDAVPRCAIGGAEAGQLGWSTWLGRRTSSRDADDAIFVAREAQLAES